MCILEMIRVTGHRISHDLGMQFRVVLGCGLPSNWSTASDGKDEHTVLLQQEYIYYREESIECYSTVR